MISQAEVAASRRSGGGGGGGRSFFDRGDPDSDRPSVGRSSSFAFDRRRNIARLRSRLRSTAELTAPYELLTIAIDSRHSCPDLCSFVHPLLPPWVRFRQLSFGDEVDLAEKLEDERGHVIVVARTNIVNIANWAVERRRNNTDDATATVSTGLFHNADERFHKGEIVDVYDKFDYVLRQYYRTDDDGKFHGYALDALGNRTCGTTKRSLPLGEDERGPRWGVHYVPLNAHTVDVNLLRHPASSYPTRLRPTNCSFVGRGDVKRSKGERAAMKSAVDDRGRDLNCSVTFTGSFASGNGKFEYLNYDLGLTKIGLSPRGSAVETHRLAELLRMGTVPAIVEEEYLSATFRKVPAIVAKDWPEVVGKMREYLVEEREFLARGKANEGRGDGGGGAALSKLERLSREGTKFYRDLEDCMMADMDFLLRGAFGMPSREEYEV
ncbi:hypothetical protein ACHAWF_012478 [Thalassiosira exigua]